CEWIRRACVPQQCRRLLERRAFGERGGADTTIDRAVFGDGRDGGVHHRQVGRFQPLRLNQRRAAVLEAAPILGGVAAGSGAVAGRLGANQSPADIGVEGGRRDGEFGRRFAGGEIER